MKRVRSSVHGDVYFDTDEVAEIMRKITSMIPHYVAKTASRYVSDAFDASNHATTNFAILFGREAMTDNPLTLQISLPIEDEHASWPAWEINIRELLLSWLEMVGPGDRSIDGLRKIVPALRDLADELESLI